MWLIMLFIYSCADKHLGSSILSMLMNKAGMDCIIEALNVDIHIYISWTYIVILYIHIYIVS